MSSTAVRLEALALSTQAYNMNIRDLISPDLIIPELSARTKTEVLAEMVDHIVRFSPHISPKHTLEVLLEREKLGSTAIGDGVAIPHGKIADTTDILIVVARSTPGVDFGSRDGKPVHSIVLVLAPVGIAGTHLKILAAFARILGDEGFRRAFLEAPAHELEELVRSFLPGDSHG